MVGLPHFQATVLTLLLDLYPFVEASKNITRVIDKPAKGGAENQQLYLLFLRTIDQLPVEL